MTVNHQEGWKTRVTLVTVFHHLKFRRCEKMLQVQNIRFAVQAKWTVNRTEPNFGKIAKGILGGNQRDRSALEHKGPQSHFVTEPRLKGNEPE
jgi:hypothetical protein